MKKFTKLWRSFLLISMAWAAISVSGQVVEKNNTRQKTFQMTEKQISAEKSIELKAEQKAMQKKEILLKKAEAMNLKSEEVNALLEKGFSLKELNDEVEMSAKALEILADLNQQEELKGINLSPDVLSPYVFAQSSGTYTEITGGTVLGSETSDDQYFVDPTVPLGGSLRTGVGFDIGFNFDYNGYTFDKFGVNNNGWIGLGQSSETPSVDMNTSSSYNPLSSTTTISPVQLRSRIAPFARDLQAQTGAELRYELTGTSPNQVLIIQFKNYKRYGSTGTGDSYSFQIKLYETSNVVELVYGTITNNTTSTTVQVGLGGTSATDFSNRTTLTDWAATTAGATSSETCTVTDLIYPASGLTFGFTPPAVFPPSVPSDPSPANLASPVLITTDLGWTFGDGTDTYDLLLDVVNPPGSMVISGATATNPGAYNPPADLSYSTTYYWQVIEHGVGGDTYGPVWSFTTSTNLPYAATNPSPASGVSGVAIDANLTWDFGLNTETYDLYFDVVNPPLVKVADNLTAVGSGLYDPPADLDNNQIYYWQVVSKNAAKAETPGTIWNFTTVCGALAPSWTEGFESVVTPAFPDCWFKENGGWVTTTNSNSTYDADARTGTQFLRNSWSAVDEYMWTPGFDLTASTSYDFVFWWAGDNYAGWTGDVFVNSDQVSTGATQMGASFVEAGTTTTKVYQKVTRTFVPTTSGTYYFAIRVNELTGSPWYLSFDDFSLDLTPTCVEPTGLSVTSITQTTANFNWNPQGTETIWHIEVGIPGFLPGTGAQTQLYTKTVSGEPTPTVTQALSGLTSSTSYDVYVQADCGTDEVSGWAGPENFATLCSAVTSYPYTEGFEDVTFPPICWDNDTWVQSLYGGAHSGTEWAYSNLSGSNLTTPEFVLNDNYTLDFWYRAESSSYPQDFDVLLSTDGVTFGTTLASFTGVTNTTYANEIINLDAYNGSSVWIRFVGLYGTGGFDFGVCIDDVTVDLTPTCPDPTDLGVANNIGGFIDLMWNSGSGQSDVEWGVSPYTLGTNAAVPATGGVLNIGPLTTGETYDFYVTDDCSGSFSNPVGPFTFTYYPAPANDLCSSPQPVNGPYPVTGIAGTTLGANEDCPVFLPVESGYVWYAIDLPYAHNYIVMDIFGDALLDNGWIVGTDVMCSCDANDYYYATSWTFAPPSVTGLTWEDVPGPGTFYYPMATGTYQENFTFDVNVTGPPVVDPAPLSLNNTLVENQNGSEDLAIGNIGGFDLAYMANIQYSGGTETASPSNVDYWTGSTDGTTFTDVSEVRCIGDAESGWMRFDVSGVVLPPGAIISSIELNCYVNATNWPYWYINNLTSDPLITDPATLDTEIRDVTEYYNYNTESSTYAAGWKLYELGGNAITDFETALGSGWFALGLFDEDGGTSYYVNFDGHNDANPPYLTITYVVGATGWLSLNGGESVTGDVLAGDPADQIMVGFDAAGLAPDVYTANIRVTSNDPVMPIMDVPVTLTVVAGIAAELTVLLEGPYDAAGTMFQTLNSGGYIPLNQPYNPSLPYYGNVAPKWLYAGTESVAAIPTDVVDWVVVQVRDAADGASASSATIEAEQAAFVLADGSIVGLDGMSRLGFAGVTIDNGLFMVVYHRNHLGVMSATALTNVGGFYDYDFSSAETQVYGGANGHKDLGDGYWGMIAADGDANGLIQATDETGAWKTDLGASGYLGGDFDMNGLGQGTDETGYWVPNLGGGGQVPAKASDTGYQSQIPK